MTERTETFIDKSGWSAGPWHQEPDKVQWVDEETGLDCLARRVGPASGHWCGYVGVPPGHALYRTGYSDCDHLFEVHGGLTFSDTCHEDQEHGICHVPEAGRTDKVWWFGFDCAHCFDFAPEREALWGKYPFQDSPGASMEAYRDLTYVRAECAKLAAQLAAVKV